ncbi:hypothetical protein DYB25_003594, partial [Aphanomyces astaci]
GSFSVQLPPGVTAPTNAITITFEPTLQDLLRPQCVYDAASSTVTVTLTGSKGIKQDAFVTLFIHGIATHLLAGPGVVLHTGDDGTTITLFNDWSTWRSLVQENFIAAKAGRPTTKFADPSLRPKTIEVVRGDAGVTFAADFFGQCAVVAELDPLKAVDGLVAKDDVLSAIVFQNNMGVPERINAIKPFALSGSSDNTHFNTVMAALSARVKSEEPYTLHFLRLHSHYMQMGDRTTLTFHALTNLGPNSTIVVEMPTADWKAKDVEAIDVEFLKPATVRASKTYWNAASHVFEITLSSSCEFIGENSQVILALTGIQGVADKSAGPSEVTVAESGRMRLELHDHWHSFLGGSGGVAPENLVDVLTRLKTSPLDLWTILEYAHLLFRMFQDESTQLLPYENAMLFREAVTGEGGAMDVDKWTKFCRGIDAKPRVGLTEKQFTCSVLELLNLDRRFLSAKFEGHDLKRLYVHLHSVDKLFDEALDLFEDGHNHTTVHIDSLRGLHKACFPSLTWSAFLEQMQKTDVTKYEWTQNDFYRIFALANKKVNPVDAWVKLHYSKLLFEEFARVKVMRKQELRDLLSARKSSFELDDDVWAKLCATIEGDHGTASSGITCGGFVQLYPSAAFGNRDSILDWNYIQAYKMEPEPPALAAEIQAAPERISVNDIAANVLDTVASTDDFAEEAVNAGIAFSRTEEVVERVIELKAPAWTTSFESNLATREKGMLHLSVKCASELRDTADSDALSTALEQYYVVVYTITGTDWNDEFKKPKRKPWRKKAREVLFGQRQASYKCAPHEVWDEGQSQELVASYESMEHQFEQYPHNQDDYQASRNQMVDMYHTMNPYATTPVDLRSHRMISRLVNKDPLTEGVVKFSTDRFRLYVDGTRTTDRQTHVVIKLFKRTEKARKFNPQKYERLLQATIELGRAEKSERVIRGLLDKQKQLLVESLHLYDVTAELEQQMTKFKRKEHEADALAHVIVDLRGEVTLLENEQAAWRQNQKRAKFKVKCVGQTALPIQDFLDVLHDDSLETDDLAMIFDDDQKVAGKLLLQVQYKCDTISKMADAQPLVAIDPDKLEYPADAPLTVTWTTSDEFRVQQGDSISLVRENDDKKVMLNTSFFTLFWNPTTGNWDIFDSSVGLYSNGETKADILHRTISPGGGSAAGWFLLPSARDLSLPPGTYRLSLIRKETIEGVNYRSSVGVSAGLNVYVGINSIHTVFGTTPLVDVKTVKCSLSIVDTTTSQVIQVSTMPVASSPWWFRACGYDAELDNSIAMLHAECTRLDDQLAVRDLRAAKRKRLEDQLALFQMKVRGMEEAKLNGVAGIKTQQAKTKAELDALLVEWEGQLATATDKVPLEQHILQIEARCQELEDQVKGWALIRLEYEKRHSVPNMLGASSNTAPPNFSYASNMRVDFLLEGAGGVSPQLNPHLNDLTHDSVLILPQVIVETSDRLRVKRTNRIRKQIQWELQIMLTVVQFANASLLQKARTYKSLWTAWKKLRNVRWLYVFEECLPLFHKGSPKLKAHFPAIIAELIEELQCRTTELELENQGQVKNNLFRRQVPIKESGFAQGDLCGVAGSVHGPVVKFVGADVSDGDMYICKYMRRGHNRGSLGELGRVGPFAIQSTEPKSSWFTLSIHQKLALVESGFHFFVLALKYFVALLNLSFNVSFVSNLALKVTWPHLNFDAVRDLQQECLKALRDVVPVIKEIFAWFDEFFASLLEYVMVDLNIFKFFANCTHGAGMVVNWIALWATALFLYIVIQEDILAKVQKIGSYLPFELGKTGEDRFEQLGSILVSPVLIVIKVLILFIAQQWTAFSNELQNGRSFTQPEASQQCAVAGLDYALQVIGASLLITFFYFFFPLLVLDMFSWVPPFDLKSDDERIEASHHGRKQGIHDSVDNNVNLIDYGDNAKDPKWSRWCSFRNLFWFHGSGQRIFMDYKYSNFHKLTKTYGYVGIWFVILYVYTVLLLQSIVRALGAVFGWRGKRGYMYPRAHLRGASSWTDKFCCRFNSEWKRYWLFKKVIKPLLDVFAVTFGLWSHDRWDVYDIEERGKNCFPMEPNNEVKQLQMMALHGKVNSLLWLPFSSAGVLTFISDCMNRGPILSYFLNDQFLQADKPESERVGKVKLRLMRWGKARDDHDETGVVYLLDTEFLATLTKWLSSMVELASVLTLVLMPLINQSADGLGTPAAAALIAAFVAPVMEFNHQLLKTYRKFQEFAKVEQANLQESLQGAINTAQSAAKAVASNDMAKVVNLEQGGLSQIQSQLHLNDDTTGALGDAVSAANEKATKAVTDKIKDAEKAVADKLGIVGVNVEFAPLGDNVGGGDEDETESEDDECDDGDDSDDDDEKDKSKDTKGDLVVLSALPEVSYIIQSDQLDVGEGEVTVSWRVNSKRRFHASDAIGMFPARSLDNILTRRTMDQCVCYRLVSDSDAEPLGWKPDAANENHQDKVMIKRAVALEKILHRKIGSLHRTSERLAKESNDKNEATSNQDRPEAGMADGDGGDGKQLVDFTHAESMFEHVLAHSPPSPKKMHDILLEEIEEHKDEFDGHAIEDAMDNNHDDDSASAAKSSKTVNGHVKFRPCNSNEAEDHPRHEDFVFGNAAGIYPCKYGMEKYEFLYLRYVGNKLNDERDHSSRASYAVVDNQEATPLLNDAERRPSGGHVAMATAPEDFDPLNKFSSNAVGVGTFDLFIRLSSDSPLMWANQAVNVSWNIYGVSYEILAHPKNKNCIAFYKVRDIHNTRNCTKLDIVPPSAFFANHGSGPVTGRMMVTTPSEPGMYEIRFLFNYFHAAKLHRRCQVFGLLEENMQSERISNLFVKRDMAQSLGLLHHQEQPVWNTALLQAYAWYLPILDSLLVVASATAPDVLEHPAKFAKSMMDEFGSSCERLVCLPTLKLQACLERMLQPLWTTGFLTFLHGTFSQSQDMVAHAKSFTFVSPTDPYKDTFVSHQLDMLRAAAASHKHGDDEPNVALTMIRLLHDDADLVRFGPSAFEQMALDYLDARSYLPGHLDLLDDLILAHSPLLHTTSLILDNVAITCCALYEPAVNNAVQGFFRHAKEDKKMGLFQDMDVHLKDGCRSHLAKLIRAAFETDIRTGEKYGGWRLDDDVAHCTMSGASVLMHRALRSWIKPRLVKYIMKTLARRHASLTSSNVAVAKQMARKVCRRVPEFRRSAAESANRQPKSGQSVVYFLHQSQF